VLKPDSLDEECGQNIPQKGGSVPSAKKILVISSETPK
jgi:hypothetical protein